MAGQRMEYIGLNRSELKYRFTAGRMPTEEDFMSLIDSMVNAVDDGFRVSEENGLEIKQRRDNSRLASFFSNLAERKPEWFASVRKNIEQGETCLNIKTPEMKEDETAVTLLSKRSAENPEGASEIRMGVGCVAPQSELDVNGVIASKGRLGYENENLEVVADGEWHDVTEVLTGCQCFEIVAGVGGNEGDGKFALAHAIAVNTFNKNPSINLTQSYSGGRGSKIDIRWKTAANKFEFTLQLRVHHKYDDEGKVKVRYRLTKLWYDTQMIGSIGK
ncbi:hypothetical protein B7991_01095 [Fibrobacter sp. UWB3]|nr:hypothetical protein B7991_01095 [Fibrobacter sp. UWB3]